MFLYLKYLGIVLSAVDDDWTAVIRNLTKSIVVWRRMTRILSREGARLRVSGFFFEAVVQSVLLFGVETWVVTPHMGRVMRFFPITGGTSTDRADATVEVGREMVLHLGGGGERGGEVRANGNLHSEKA